MIKFKDYIIEYSNITKLLSGGVWTCDSRHWGSDPMMPRIKTAFSCTGPKYPLKIQSILKGQGFQNIPPLLSLVTPKFPK